MTGTGPGLKATVSGGGGGGPSPSGVLASVPIVGDIINVSGDIVSATGNLSGWGDITLTMLPFDGNGFYTNDYTKTQCFKGQWSPKHCPTTTGSPGSVGWINARVFQFNNTGLVTSIDVDYWRDVSNGIVNSFDIFGPEVTGANPDPVLQGWQGEANPGGFYGVGFIFEGYASDHTPGTPGTGTLVSSLALYNVKSVVPAC